MLFLLHVLQQDNRYNNKDYKQVQVIYKTKFMIKFYNIMKN